MSDVLSTRRQAAQALFDWLFRTEASTRSSALIRIFMAVTCWSALSRYHFLFDHPTAFGAIRSTLFFAATTTMFFGLWSRASSFVVGLLGLYLVYWVGLHGGDAQFTHHNTRILAIGTFLVAFTPCGGSYSVDRWLALRRSERIGQAPPPEVANVWGLRLIAFQLAAVYFFSAWDKTHWGFLSGARMEHYAAWYYWGSAWPPHPALPTLMAFMAVGTVVFEYALAVGLFFRIGRRYLVIPALIMHGAFHWLLHVSAFTAVMWTLYLAVFDPAAVHRLIDRLSGHARFRHASKPDDAEGQGRE